MASESYTILLRGNRINGVLQASYRYDYLGHQLSRPLTGSLTIHSVFDSAGNRIAEYNQATGVLIREYVWLNGAPVAVVEGGVIYYVRTDHIGRPIFATNAAGVKVWTASYLPFGGLRVSTGVPLALRFPGQWFQSESGLHQNWMRDYDPTTGRYLQADPLGLIAGTSLYSYANQNPTMYIDPNGENPILIGIGISIALNVAVGYLLDPDCYTLDEFGRDASIGAALGPLGAYGSAGKLGAGVGSLADDALNAASRGWTLGEGKSAGKWAAQMERRGWSSQQIDKAIRSGNRFDAPNNLNPGNGATRYVHPETGRSVVIDNVTGQIIHVGGDGFVY